MSLSIILLRMVFESTVILVTISPALCKVYGMEPSTPHPIISGFQIDVKQVAGAFPTAFLKRSSLFPAAAGSMA